MLTSVGRLVTTWLTLLLQAEIEEAARLANAHAFICALPQGYATQACLPLPFGMRMAERIERLLKFDMAQAPGLFAPSQCFQGWSSAPAQSKQGCRQLHA